jgi:biopolymer transport protein ExbD
MRRRYYKQEDESTIDMTPMLDIVFIMLIFFIVTSSFIKESGVDVSSPGAATAERKERGNIGVDRQAQCRYSCGTCQHRATARGKS